jgi:hypothetical protein
MMTIKIRGELSRLPFVVPDVIAKLVYMANTPFASK